MGVSITANSTSFFVGGLKFGDEVAIAVNGEVVQKFNIQNDKAKIGLYVNRERSDNKWS